MMISHMLKNRTSVWGDISNESVDHSRGAKWLNNLQSEVLQMLPNKKRYNQVKCEEDSWKSAKKILGRMPNWK